MNRRSFSLLFEHNRMSVFNEHEVFHRNDLLFMYLLSRQERRDDSISGRHSRCNHSPFSFVYDSVIFDEPFNHMFALVLLSDMLSCFLFVLYIVRLMKFPVMASEEIANISDVRALGVEVPRDDVCVFAMRLLYPVLVSVL